MPTTPREIRQPVPRPATVGEYLAIRDHLVDTHGNPLRLIDCPGCSRQHFTVEPCAAEVPCPSCGSRTGRCRRPSEHDASEWHADRHAAFEALCSDREAAGIPQVARWPDTPESTPLFDWPAPTEGSD